MRRGNKNWWRKRPASFLKTQYRGSESDCNDGEGFSDSSGISDEEVANALSGLHGSGTELDHQQSPRRTRSLTLPGESSSSVWRRFRPLGNVSDGPSGSPGAMHRTATSGCLQDNMGFLPQQLGNSEEAAILSQPGHSEHFAQRSATAHSAPRLLAVESPPPPSSFLQTKTNGIVAAIMMSKDGSNPVSPAFSAKTNGSVPTLATSYALSDDDEEEEDDENDSVTANDGLGCFRHRVGYLKEEQQQFLMHSPPHTALPHVDSISSGSHSLPAIVSPAYKFMPIDSDSDSDNLTVDLESSSDDDSSKNNVVRDYDLVNIDNTDDEESMGSVELNDPVPSVAEATATADRQVYDIGCDNSIVGETASPVASSRAAHFSEGERSCFTDDHHQLLSSVSHSQHNPERVATKAVSLSTESVPEEFQRKHSERSSYVKFLHDTPEMQVPPPNSYCCAEESWSFFDLPLLLSRCICDWKDVPNPPKMSQTAGLPLQRSNSMTSSNSSQSVYSSPSDTYYDATANPDERELQSRNQL